MVANLTPNPCTPLLYMLRVGVAELNCLELSGEKMPQTERDPVDSGHLSCSFPFWCLPILSAKASFFGGGSMQCVCRGGHMLLFIFF